jgi:hypothetical protein
LYAARHSGDSDDGRALRLRSEQSPNPRRGVTGIIGHDIGEHSGDDWRSASCRYDAVLHTSHKRAGTCSIDRRPNDGAAEHLGRAADNSAISD